jgi:hypothetical protein
MNKHEEMENGKKIICEHGIQEQKDKKVQPNKSILEICE